jgi:hypothetical protein
MSPPCKRACMYQAQAKITLKGKRVILGHFKDELEAAKAYDKAAHSVLGR